jgi:hypothetical protein
VKIDVITVTPELAERWLGANTHNRHVRSTTVQQWMKDMQAGEWRRDTDPIRFHGYFDDPPELASECTETGCNGQHPVLLNGQHRLNALVQARMSLEFVVIEGLDMLDQSEMDTGNKRALADQLRLDGHPNAVELAGALRMAYLYERDELRGTRHVTPSASALLRWLEKHPSLVGSIPPARQLYVAIGGRVTVYATAHYVLSQLPAAGIGDDVDAWWDMLRYGENLKNGDPALVLRNAMLSLSSGGGYRRRLSQIQSLAIFFKAWNAWRDDGSIHVLSWRATGASPEAFPRPY